MPGKLLAIAAIAGLACGPACSPKSTRTGDGSSGSGASGAAAPTFTLFALAELRGQIEPCGCTTDPLGDISRTARMIADARAKGPVIVVDAGSLLYSKSPVPPHLVAQEELKADLLAGLYKDELQVAALGLGPMDLAAGAGKLRLPREIANLGADAVVAGEPPRIVEAGGAKVGVFGVATADVVPGVTTTDPITAGKAARDDLRKRGATVVIALIQAASKKDAVGVVRGIGGGVDIAVLGLGTQAPEPDEVRPRAEDIDGAWIVIPGNRGQVVSKLEIGINGDGPLVDAIGLAAARAIQEETDRQIQALLDQVEAFSKDPQADPAFVETKKAELEAAKAERDNLVSTPVRVPPKGSWFTLEQVRITKKLACDPEVDALKAAYDRAAGEANVKAGAGIKPPAPPKGTAGYAGIEACEDCHAEAVEFWKTTRHAQAWETLDERGKQFDFDCIGCHVTGWDRPGGANIGFNEPLRDVQCETCHGPASIHLAKDGAPGTITRAPAPELCAGQCHTKEHSDTFQLEAYLRDVTGPGHGVDRRKALGDGPTGHELRAAGLAKAGAALGEGCKK
jgi:hypothetical protein